MNNHQLKQAGKQMFFIFLMFFTTNSYATNYQFSLLGTLGWNESFANDINDAGQVVGELYRNQHELHAFLYESGNGMQDLGTLGGNYGSSSALAINSKGQVIGYTDSSISSGKHAFIYDSVNGMQDIGTLGGNNSYAHGINDAGQVVGYSSDINETNHAFMFDSVNGMQGIGTLGGNYSYAYGINETGQVVGSSTSSNHLTHAFIYDSINGMQDLGTLGGNYSSAHGINDAGQAVGVSTNSSEQQHAFVYDSVNGMQDLGTLGGSRSLAREINDAGQVVGVSYDINNQSHAFIYDSNQGMVDLNDLLTLTDLEGWVLADAFSINNNGDIVGEAFKAGVGSQAFLLTNISAVPIPPAVLLFAPALLGFVGLRRQFKFN